MGHWSVYCNISRIAIGSGGAVMIPLTENKKHDGYDKYIPATLPIFGEYNTYGQLENIVEDENTAIIEKTYNCTIQEFCDFLVDGRRDYTSEYSDWKGKEHLKPLEAFTYMWVKREVWDFLKNLHPKSYGRGGDFDMGNPSLLEALGFVHIGKTKDKRYTEHYRYTNGEIVVNLMSDGTWCHILNDQSQLIYDISHLKKLGVDTTQFDGKEEHNMYSIFDHKTRLKKFGYIIGISRDFDMYDMFDRLSSKSDNPELKALAADFSRYAPQPILKEYIAKMAENGYISETIADLHTVKHNLYAASTSWEPHVHYITPQDGEYRTHQLMFEGFAAINKQTMTDHGYDDEEEDD